MNEALDASRMARAGWDIERIRIAIDQRYH